MCCIFILLDIYRVKTTLLLLHSSNTQINKYSENKAKQNLTVYLPLLWKAKMTSE